MNPQSHPAWREVWGRRRQAEAVVSALMRRALPFEKRDLVEILQWCRSDAQLSGVFGPIGSIARALERYASKTPLDPELRNATRQFAEQLRSSHDKEVTRLATSVEQLCADAGTATAAHPSSAVETLPAPEPRRLVPRASSPSSSGCGGS